MTAHRIAQIWYPCNCTLYAVAAAFWHGGELPDAGFALASLWLVIALLGPVLYWQRTRMVRAWWVVWPLLVLAATLALVTIAALKTRDPILTIVAATTPLFAAHLLWNRIGLSLRAASGPLTRVRRMASRRGRSDLWEYHFIDHLNDETTTIYHTGHKREDDPFLVYPVQDARSSTDMGPALFEHPPHDGDAVIDFHVAPIPERVPQVGIRGYYGIMDAFTDKNSVKKRTTFEARAQNKVRFEIVVDDELVVRDDLSGFGWISVDKGPFQPHDRSLMVELKTNALGEAHCNWAAWGELKLVECN